MQKDGTALALDEYTTSKTVPANTTRFTFDLIGFSEELRVHEFEGDESISKPFEFKLTLASKNDLLTPEQFMGKTGLLTFVAHEQNELLHGDIARFEQYSEQGDFLLYRITLVPRFWFLKKRHNHRIFQALSVPQIIEQVFNDAGMNPRDYDFRLADDYSPREYCVQYNENEFDFVSLLME
jgi:type VI secretion system secreted protein VgrG